MQLYGIVASCVVLFHLWLLLLVRFRSIIYSLHLGLRESACPHHLFLSLQWGKYYRWTHSNYVFKFFNTLCPPGACRGARTSRCDRSYRGSGKKPGVILSRILFIFFIGYRSRLLQHVQGFFSVNETNFIARMLFCLQGLMGRPGPMGQQGGKGEKVRWFLSLKKCLCNVCCAQAFQGYI